MNPQTSIIALTFLVLPFVSNAATYDIGFTGGSSDIFFSKPELQAGDHVRVYARVLNFGTNDVAAQVVFYQGDAIIDQPQVVSIRAGGVMDEVYVDWTVPQSSFNLRAEVKAQSPGDENKSNDAAVTAFITPKSPPPPSPPPSSSTAGLASSVSSGGGTSTATPAAPTPKAVVPSARVASASSAKSAIAQTPSVVPVASAREVEGVMLAGLSPIIDPLTDDLLKVRVELSQKDWNTFDFHADVNRGGETSVTWSFGDGTSSRGIDARHSFSGAGRYVVSVVAVGPDGERAQEKVTLDISFWHLGNWQLWIIFLGLCGFAGLMTMLARKQQKPLDDGSDSILVGVPMVEERVILPAPKPIKKRVVKQKKKIQKKVEKPTEPPALEPPSVS